MELIFPKGEEPKKREQEVEDGREKETNQTV